MESPIKSNDYSVINDDNFVPNEDETINFRPYIAWALIIIGGLLILNASSLGINTVRHGDGFGYSWNPDQARDAAWNFRSLGAMCFVAGLCERLLGEIRSLKAK